MGRWRSRVSSGKEKGRESGSSFLARHRHSLKYPFHALPATSAHAIRAVP